MGIVWRSVKNLLFWMDNKKSMLARSRNKISMAPVITKKIVTVKREEKGHLDSLKTLNVKEVSEYVKKQTIGLTV